MTPEQTLTYLNESLQAVALLKRRLKYMQTHPIPTFYWDISSRTLALVVSLECALQEDKQQLEELWSSGQNLGPK